MKYDFYLGEYQLSIRNKTGEIKKWIDEGSYIQVLTFDYENGGAKIFIPELCELDINKNLMLLLSIAKVYGLSD